MRQMPTGRRTLIYMPTRHSPLSSGVSPSPPTAVFFSPLLDNTRLNTQMKARLPSRSQTLCTFTHEGASTRHPSRTCPATRSPLLSSSARLFSTPCACLTQLQSISLSTHPRQRSPFLSCRSQCPKPPQHHLSWNPHLHLPQLQMLHRFPHPLTSLMASRLCLPRVPRRRSVSRTGWCTL